MKLISNTGVKLELIPINNSKKSLKLIDPNMSKIPGILRCLNLTSVKRAELFNAFGNGVDQVLKTLKSWGLIKSVTTYYSITDLGEKYYNIIKDKKFEKFYEID